MFVILNVVLLAAGYRISYALRSRQAALLGLATGVLMVVNQWMWTSLHPLGFKQAAALALAEVLVLVPAYAMAAQRSGILLTLLNVAVGGAAATLLPFFVVDWVGR